MNEDLSIVVNDDDIDNHVEEEIRVSIRDAKNFFMFAGAGSGKTRSLVNTLSFIASEQEKNLRLKCKQVAVITYTNAACDEISRRVEYNPLFAISTIHSFLWELIKPFQKDIKIWIKHKLEADIQELTAKQNNPRSRTDYSADIAKKTSRLESLEKVLRFTYSPNRANTGRDSLDHSEVISMGSTFIGEHETMQRVLTSKFPILLIDESQDTKKELIDALWKIDSASSSDFMIGMFGDTMQRIYMDEKESLDSSIPQTWRRPNKVMNYRSNKRIIQLANNIRTRIDKQQQRPRSDKSDGFVRLFIAPSSIDKNRTEEYVYSQMSDITSDINWKVADERKVLVLEHSMAAKRIGFETLNSALAREFDQSFRDGTLSELSFLMNVVYPIVQAQEGNNDFMLMKILKANSPFLKSKSFIESTDQLKMLETTKKHVRELTSLWANGLTPNCLDIYKKLLENPLLELPRRIEEILDDTKNTSVRINSLRSALTAPFSELIAYWNYVNDKTQFSTHQGVKGLEFDRVAVIMDDESARGKLFSYEKLFGARELSNTDKDHALNGNDNSITRTTRLFYVACTRAKKSLALIAYTSDVSIVRQTVTSYNWFTPDEIVLIDEKSLIPK